MDVLNIRNIDLNPDYYGCNSAVKSVLDDKYPDFDITMTSSEEIKHFQSSTTISLSISNIRVAGRRVVPDKVSVNGTPLEGMELSETIEQTKQYDIEVSYKGKTTIKTRVYFIIRASYVLFSNPATGQFPTLQGTTVDFISDGVVRAKASNTGTAKYLWIAIPRNNVSLISVLPVGLVEELNVELVGNDGIYDFWRSTDKLNSGEWEFMLKVYADVLMNYQGLRTAPEDPDDPSSRRILKTKDGLTLKCLVK